MIKLLTVEILCLINIKTFAEPLINQNDKNKPQLIIGFDEQADLFVYKNRIFRGIKSEEAAQLYKHILHLCNKHHLFEIGIIPTKVAKNHPLNKEKYKLILEHKKIRFVSYPHEWSSEMLKEVALLQIKLHLKLLEIGLALKDSHPWNYLFDYTTPYLIDFTSITTGEQFNQEKFIHVLKTHKIWGHLYSQDKLNFYKNYQNMFLPYFLLPLYLYRQKKYPQAKQLLLDRALPKGTLAISKKDVFSLFNPQGSIFTIKEYYKKYLLLLPNGQKKFLCYTYRQIKNMPVASSRSNYLAYYQAKNEDFSFTPSKKWKNKQWIIYNVIKELQSKSVLDFAGNTGWFAKLASQLGCKAICFDIDETCINNLYKNAQKENLPILPLVFNGLKSTPDIYVASNKNKYPLLLAAQKRLKCEMVLALAIIHHLVLGENQSFERIIEILNAFTKKHLIVEFIDKTDPLVLDNLSAFFPAYSKKPSSFSWYTLENLIVILKKYFNSIKIKESDPSTRKLLLCTNRKSYSLPQL